jgi:hypothetical protein
MATEKLKRFKPPSFDQITADIIVTETKSLRSDIQKLHLE